MTFRVLSAFFFVSLVSCVAAVDPTGLKLRITNRAQNVLRDLGLEFLKTLVNYRFPEFDIPIMRGSACTIKELRLTHLFPDETQTTVHFQQDSGLYFEIKNMVFTGEFARDLNMCVLRKISLSDKNVFLAGSGVSATIEVKLKRNPQGHLNIEIPTCEVTADHIVTDHEGKTGVLWDTLKPLYHSLFNSQLCPAIQEFLVPKINEMLESITMTAMLYEHQTPPTKDATSHSIVTTALTEKDINIDYSLSDDVTVTSSCFDVPFKGVIFRQGETVDLSSIESCVVPVFSESDRMAYVGISEFTFNSAAMSLYKAGPFKIDLSETIDVIQNIVLRGLGLSKNDPFEVELTEAPIISISEDGVSTTVNARAQSLAERADGNPILPVVCKLDMKIDIKGNRLILVSKNPTVCKVRPETVKGKIVKKITNTAIKHLIKGYLESWFTKGILIPLPEGVSFTEGKISYNDGFVVIGGNLDFTKAGREEMVKRIGS